MKHDIKICVPYYNVIEDETEQAIYDLLDSDELNCALLSIQGTNIANARNMLVNDNKSDMKYQKLDTNFTHYLFLDSDVVPTIPAVKRLLDLNLDIVSSAYNSREQGFTFVGGLFKTDPAGSFLDALKLNSDTTGLMEVDWVGGGCVLVKKEVFENTPFPWFHYPVVEIEKDGNIHRKLVYEDVGFCMNVKESGYKIYMDCDTTVRHLARNYNNNIVTDQELLFKNVRDDIDKIFQLIRGMTYKNDILMEKLKDKGNHNGI